jgi:hypothetical protein
MAPRTVFSTLAAGNEPLSLFDAMFADAMNLGIIPCTATGVNTIALAPFANTPTISSYTSLAPSFAFIAAATSTGAVTINVNGIGAINAFKWNGQQALGAGDITIGETYKATYNATLNGLIVDTVGVGPANFSGGAFNSVSLEFIISGGGVAITSGVKGYLHFPWPATIGAWRIIADQSGSIVIDVLRTNAAVPTVSMIGAGNKPTLSSSQFAGGTVVSGWTSTTLASDDWLGFNVISATTVTQVTVVLAIARL